MAGIFDIDTWDEALVVGGAGALGFGLGGPLGGAVAGGVAAAYYAWDGTWGDVAWAFGGGFAGGLIGGAVGALGWRFLGQSARHVFANPSAAAIGSELAGIQSLAFANRFAWSGFLHSAAGSAAGDWAFGPDAPNQLPWKWVRDLPTFPAGMPGIKMPDQGNPQFPSKYRYDEGLQAYYEGSAAAGGRGLPDVMLAFWESFGRPERAQDVPPGGGVAEIPRLERSDGTGLRAHEAKVAELQSKFTEFQRVHGEALRLIQQGRDISRDGQEAIRKLIVGPARQQGTRSINESAPAVPLTSEMSETEWIITYLGDALEGGKRALNQALNGHRGIGNGIDALRRQYEQQNRQLAELGRRLQEQNDQRLDGNNRRIDDALTRRLDRLERLRSLRDRDRTNQTNAQLQDMLRRFNDQARNLQLAQNRPPTVAPQNTSARDGTDPLSQMLRAQLAGGFGGLGGGLLGGGLGLGGLGGGLLGNGLGRNDWQREERLRDREDELRDRERELRDRMEGRNLAPAAPPTPPMVAAAANPPPPPPPPRLDEQQSDSQAAEGDSAAHGETPTDTDEDGNRLYTFGDGRQQPVPPTVGEALDKSLNDNAGTNAQDAYQDTPAAWDDDKEIGERIDPNELQTGDVARFENTEAIAVVWGSPDSGGTLDLVVDGKLVPFDPESKEFQDLGPFVGFYHPENIDQGSSNGSTKVAGAASPVPDKPVAAVPG